MKKIIFITFIIFILFTISSSAELIIKPSSITVTTTVNQELTYTINLNNTFNFQIFDFEFSEIENKGFNFPEITLNPNETKNITFTVITTEPHSGIINSRVKFKYYVSLPQIPTTYHINITNSGFNPNYLTIKQQDTVIWKNKDTISRTVTSSLFNYNLNPNETATYTFNDIKQVNYTDTVLLYPGTINVVNKTAQSKANNPNYDKYLAVNLNSILNPTTLQVSTLENSFTVKPIDTTEGLLTIKNIGSETAQNIQLTSDSVWISFDQTNFSINSQSTKYVIYKIDPIITSTNQTNKTYNINLKIKALNTGEYPIPLNVFIPYTDVENFTDSDIEFLLWYENFCSTRQHLFICNTTVSGGTGEKIVIRDLEIPFNISAINLIEFIRRVGEVKDITTRNTNDIKSYMNKIDTTLPALEDFMNRTTLELEIKNKKEHTATNLRWIIGLFIIIILSILLIVYLKNKYEYKKNILEGDFRYR